MGDGARLDGERDAVADRFGEAGGRRQLVVVGGVGGVDRDRPREDRGTGSEVVGDRRADEPVAGEMLVGVDEARQHDPVRTAEPFRRGVARPRSSARADVDDATVVDGDRPVADHAPGRIHRDHPAASTTRSTATGSSHVICTVRGGRRDHGASRRRGSHGPYRTGTRCWSSTERSRTTGTWSPRAGDVGVGAARACACSAATSWCGAAADGAVVAAPDRCPHREAPLSLGTVTTAACRARTTGGRSATTVVACSCRRRARGARSARRAPADAARGGAVRPGVGVSRRAARPHSGDRGGRRSGVPADQHRRRHVEGVGERG